MQKRLIYFLILASAFLVMQGCATYSFKYAPVYRAVEERQFGYADSLLEKSELKDSQDNLLYFLEKGIISHYLKKYNESNMYFELAYDRAEELYTTSISKEGLSFLINDETVPYDGEDFEKVLIHYYMAMNYLYLGEYDEAFVECRRMNLKLEEYAQEYEDENVYNQDAFIHYVIGLLYEMIGEEDEAYIAYKHSYDVYQSDYRNYYGLYTPKFLKKDLLRLSDYLGFTSQHESFLKEFGNIDYPSQEEYKNNGCLVIFYENGLVPIKVQHNITHYMEEEEYYINLALPVFRERYYISDRLVVNLDGKSYHTEIFEDLEAIAIKNLEDKNALILAKAIARGVIKYQATKKARKELGAFAGFLMNVFAAATEVADTRSWQSLPANIQVVKILLPEGEYPLEFMVRQSSGGGVDYFQENIEIKKGNYTFYSYRSFR